MSVATESATFVVEYSYEATTLDYLIPRWYAFSEVEPFTSQEEAEAFVSAKYAAQTPSAGPIAYRARRVPSEAERQALLDEDAAFNQRYWADQARVAREAEEAQREMYRLYGRGATVTVVKGRKVPLGTEGGVFWLGESKFGGYSVGFKTAEGEKHFTSLGNVESLAPAYEKEA